MSSAHSSARVQKQLEHVRAWQKVLGMHYGCSMVPLQHTAVYHGSWELSSWTSPAFATMGGRTKLHTSLLWPVRPWCCDARLCEVGLMSAPSGVPRPWSRLGACCLHTQLTGFKLPAFKCCSWGSFIWTLFQMGWWSRDKEIGVNVFPFDSVGQFPVGNANHHAVGV